MVSEIKNNDNKRRKLTVKTMTRAIQLIRHVLHIFVLLRFYFMLKKFISAQDFITPLSRLCITQQYISVSLNDLEYTKRDT
jgi:hypothetical protein